MGAIKMIRERKGSNGNVLGSKEYFDSINNKVLKNIMPKSNSRNRYYDLYKDISKNLQANQYKPLIAQYAITQKNIKTNLRKPFESIVNIITKDIIHAVKGEYIRDNNAAALKIALNQLSLCGIPYLDKISKEIDKLCCFIDVDEEKVKKLQRFLNELGYGPLEVNGIYDVTTDKIWTRFIYDLESGTYGTLGNVACSGNQVASTVNVFVEYTSMLHIIENETGALQKAGAKRLVENLNNSSKIIKIGQKTVIVSSLALDALELGLAIEQDLTDADKKIGKKTWTTAAEISGSWGGIGIATLIGVGTTSVFGAVPGALTYFAATLILPEWGEKLGEYVVELVDEWFGLE